ncbi:MAG: asparagine synthase (glutamine-hydrolyzing), partial [Verrucomicrobiota bacterium]
MCGISGILHLDQKKPVDRARLSAMTDSLVHRGPDGRGLWSEGSVGLGHRRLAIIDLDSGRQPMTDEAGNVLVFNGEIYNYIELKEELESQGEVFHTESDTEVILAAYRKWGMDCQNHLNGMWAFAIWDPRKSRLFLSRDRLGEKPLYYSRFNNSLFFGSEIKSLLAGGIPTDPDLSLLEVYLCLSYVPAPHTFYKHIRSLEPGHSLVIENGTIRSHQYWDLPTFDENEMTGDKALVEERFTELFKDSVRIRMRSDVPFGAFLSGGLDSASVVSAMSDVATQPVETFTMGFDEPEFDERHLARAAAEAFGTRHHEAVIEPDSFDESLKRVLHHYDDPFGDSSAIPTSYVSRYAASKVKMVLTGDGGDEVLSGYTTYQGEKFASMFQAFPSTMQKGFASTLQTAARFTPGQWRYKANRAAKVCQASTLPFSDRLIAKITWGNRDMVKALVRNVPFSTVSIEDFIRDRMQPCSYQDPFYRLMHFHLKTSLPNDMLVKVDRMSMAHSLETRIPFLD